MAIKLDLVGKKSDPIPFAYTWKDTVLYALGVGAKVDELDFVYEGRGPKVLPTFAVVPSFTSMIAVAGDLGANPMMILHGEQKIILHRPIPARRQAVDGVGGQGRSTTRARARWWWSRRKHRRRQGRGRVRQRLLDLRARRRRLRRRARARGGQGRSAGGRGARLRGRRGDVARAGAALSPVGRRQSAARRSQHGEVRRVRSADPARAVHLRLRGARDPARARAAAIRRKLRSFGARFAGVVFPGDTLTTRGWKVGDGQYVVTVTTQEGKSVLSNAIAESRLTSRRWISDGSSTPPIELARRAGERIRALHGCGPRRRHQGRRLAGDAGRSRGQRAHRRRRSRAAFPGDGIFSEELPDDGSRMRAARVWMVDPLDGTKDFIRGRDGFAVMIGLLDGGAPALGVVYQPIGDKLYFATRGGGALLVRGGGAAERIHVSDVREASQIRMVASKSHRTETHRSRARRARHLRRAERRLGRAQARAHRRGVARSVRQSGGPFEAVGRVRAGGDPRRGGRAAHRLARGAARLSRARARQHARPHRVERHACTTRSCTRLATLFPGGAARG